MTDLSPAADAVLDAYMKHCGWLDGPLEKDYRCAAAVLRAAADQVGYYSGCNLSDELEVMYSEGWNHCSKQILAIAAELEALND